jgi:hypothetical protein
MDKGETTELKSCGKPKRGSAVHFDTIYFTPMRLAVHFHTIFYAIDSGGALLCIPFILIAMHQFIIVLFVATREQVKVSRWKKRFEKSVWQYLPQ